MRSSPLLLSSPADVSLTQRPSRSYKDLFLDSIGTLRGSGFSYRTYEPASGALHASGLVRDRRIRAGLRYSTADGGRKYWLNQPGREEDAYGRRGDGMLGGGLSSRPIHEVHRRLEERVEAREGYAPRAHDDEVLHVDPEWAEAERAKKRAMDDSAGPLGLGWWEGGRAYDQLDDGDVSDAESLEFHPVDETEEKEVERLYRESRELEYGASRSLPLVPFSAPAAVLTPRPSSVQVTGSILSSTPLARLLGAAFATRRTPSCRAVSGSGPTRRCALSPSTAPARTAPSPSGNLSSAVTRSRSRASSTRRRSSETRRHGLGTSRRPARTRRRRPTTRSRSARRS